MNKKLPFAKKTNAYKAHKRDFLWQILAPMLITLILIIAASVATTLRPATTASLWADISVIWLLIPLLFFALITLIILSGIVYGMAKLLDITPTYTRKLYLLIRHATDKIEDIADISAKPIIFVEGISASIKSLFQPK